MSDDPTPGQLEIEETRGRPWRNLSIVWIVPVIALIVSLAVAWRAYDDRGVLIQITFATGEGLEAGQSVLKYRDVTVGKVEKIGFTPDFSHVLVSVRVEKNVAARIGKDAQFWIVRPEIGFSGVTGLNTVLSGVYIEGQWSAAPPGTPPARFAGLEKAPLAASPDSGSWVTIETPDGGALVDGAPVMLRGIKVGELRDIRLAPSGNGVLVDAFIKAPYNKQLTTASVFWNASGFSVSLGPSGVSLNVRSLSSLIQGGIEFGTFTSGGGPIAKGQTYQLFSDEAAARDSIFSDTGAPKVKMSILMSRAVRDLKTGASVTYRGLKVGEVSHLAIEVSTGQDGRRLVRQRVDFTLIPERMGLKRGTDRQTLMNFLDQQVAHGLRARVTATGLLGGQLEIELIDKPEAKPEMIDAKAKPFPVMPSLTPKIPDVSASAQGLLSRINALPIEDVMQSTISLLNNANKLIAQKDTQEVPGQIAGLVEDLRKVVNSPGVQAAPDALNKALSGADAFFAALQKAGTVNSISAAMSDASAAAQAVTDSAKGVPGLVETYKQLGDKVNKLALDKTVENANALIASLNTLASSKETAKLPQSLNQALASLDQMLGELNKGGAAENLNKTLAKAGDAAQSVQEATAKLPELAKRLDAVVAGANQVLASYGANSRFNADTLATLRQLRDAASAIAQTARMIQRNPQAFILGR